MKTKLFLLAIIIVFVCVGCDRPPTDNLSIKTRMFAVNSNIIDRPERIVEETIIHTGIIEKVETHQNTWLSDTTVIYWKDGCISDINYLILDNIKLNKEASLVIIKFDGSRTVARFNYNLHGK